MGGAGRPVNRLAKAAARAAALAATLGALLSACTLLLPRELRIAAWSPDSPTPDPSSLAIWVEFSADVNATSAEEAFTLTEDGAAVRGDFSWTGRRLSFAPLREVTAGKDYVISVAASAEDLRGVSLEEGFRFRFSTRSERGRPSVLSVQPEPGSTTDDRYHAIVVRFSEAMDAASVLRALRVSPPVAGSFSWSADRTTLTLSPAAPYDWQAEYVVQVARTAADSSGNTMIDDLSWSFSVGSDSARPVLLEVRSHDGTGPGTVVAAVDDPGTPGLSVTPGWESTWGFRLSFDEPVSRESLVQEVTLEPGCALAVLPEEDWAQVFVLVPAQRLPWDTVCTLAVRAGVTDRSGNRTDGGSFVHVRTDGPASRPPRVLLVRFRGTPTGSAARPVDFDPAAQLSALPVTADDFPVGAALVTWFDLHVALADGAGLDLLSAAGHFTVGETCGCLAMAVAGLQAEGFDEPVPAAVAGTVPLRVHVTIVNRAASGTVTIGLAEGFSDSRGNPLATAWQLRFLK